MDHRTKKRQSAAIAAAERAHRRTGAAYYVFAYSVPLADPIRRHGGSPGGVRAFGRRYRRARFRVTRDPALAMDRHERIMLTIPRRSFA